MGEVRKINMKNRILNFNFIAIAFFVVLSIVSPVIAQEEYQQYFDKAKAASEAGRLEEAIKLYEKVLELNYNFVPAYIGLGKIYEQRTDDVEAIAWYFNSALKIDPNNIEAYESLGRCYQRANQPEMAEKYFKKVLEIDPNSVGAQYSLAWTCLFGRSPADAVNYFNAVLSKTKLPMAYYGLGLAYSRLGENAQILEIVTELKSMGQIELATKLENAIREPWDPTKQAVKAPENPPPAPAQSSSIGTSSVRLRGKLYNIDSSTKPAQGDH